MAGRKEDSVNCKSPAAAALLALATLVFAACGGDDEEAGDTSGDNALSGPVVLEADDFYFEPAALTADPGQTLSVKVANEGAAEHTFTIDGLGIDAVIAAGEDRVVEVSSSEAGEFEFYCRYHSSQMSGTITIGQGGAASTKDSSGGGSGYGY